MGKIWFLARSMYPYNKTGGGQIRAKEASFLQNSLDMPLTAVIPCMGDCDGAQAKRSDFEILRIPYRRNEKLATLMEMTGLLEDYLDAWVADSFEILKETVTKHDLVFATTGGEVATLKLGAMFKEHVGCSLVYNYHDPLAYSLVKGKKLPYYFHVSREKSEKKYITYADLILTSSKYYAEALKEKYPKISKRIFTAYFGYIERYTIPKIDIEKKDSFSIAYAGTMSAAQGPEILYKALRDEVASNKVTLYYIGKRGGYAPIEEIKSPNVHKIDYMEHAKLLDFMAQEIDVGFVSLADEYFAACVPSKIFEYINLGLPILGALPQGDAMEIINENSYGKACHFEDYKCLRNAVLEMREKKMTQTYRENIIGAKEAWSFERQFADVVKLLKRLV